MCLNLNTVLSKQPKSHFEIVELYMLTTWVHLTASITLNFSGLKVWLLSAIFFFNSLYIPVATLPNILDDLFKNVSCISAYCIAS